MNDYYEFVEGRREVVVTWNYNYATYPFIYAADVGVAFLAKCFLLGGEGRQARSVSKKWTRCSELLVGGGGGARKLLVS